MPSRVLFLAGNCAGVVDETHRFAELSGGLFAPPMHEAGPVFPSALQPSASRKFRTAQLLGKRGTVRIAKHWCKLASER